MKLSTRAARRISVAAAAVCAAIFVPALALAAPGQPAEPGGTRCGPPVPDAWPGHLAGHQRQRRSRQRLLPPGVHQPVRAALHAERLPLPGRRRPARTPAGAQGFLRSLDRPAPGDPGPRQDRYSGAASGRRRQLSADRVSPGHRRRPARLPAEPDQVQDRPVPVAGLLEDEPAHPDCRASQEVTPRYLPWRPAALSARRQPGRRPGAKARPDVLGQGPGRRPATTSWRLDS